jgi:hypothetical protein
VSGIVVGDTFVLPFGYTHPRTRTTGGFNRGHRTRGLLPQAQAESRKGGEQGKQLLKARLDN